jgi:hypothetical protein
VCKVVSHSKKAKEMLAQRMDEEDEDYNPDGSDREDESSDSDNDLIDMSDNEIIDVGGEKSNDCSENDSSDDDSSDDDSAEDSE